MLKFLSTLCMKCNYFSLDEFLLKLFSSKKLCKSYYWIYSKQLFLELMEKLKNHSSSAANELDSHSKTSIDINGFH